MHFLPGPFSAKERPFCRRIQGRSPAQGGLHVSRIAAFADSGRSTQEARQHLTKAQEGDCVPARNAGAPQQCGSLPQSRAFREAGSGVSCCRFCSNCPDEKSPCAGQGTRFLLIPDRHGKGQRKKALPVLTAGTPICSGRRKQNSVNGPPKKERAGMGCTRTPCRLKDSLVGSVSETEPSLPAD